MLLRILIFLVVIAASLVLPAIRKVDALNASVDMNGVDVETGLRYAEGEMGLMDVYRPSDRTGEKLPLLVFVHGGAWKSGDRAMYRFLAAPLAKAGMVVAVPDYRKAPQVMFPDFLTDNARATAFARAHAAAWGADPQRIFLAGHSAGGYNVLMLGLDQRFLASVGMKTSDIAGVIGIAAPADFFPSTDPDVIAAFGAHPDPAVVQPIAFARADAPPLLLLHGDKDDIVGVHNTTSLAEHMQKAGGRVTVKRFPSLDHIQIVLAIAPISAWLGPVRPAILDFIGNPD